jgi:hypothetical protein
MYFILTIMMVILGISIASFPMFLPIETIYHNQSMLMMLPVFGAILALVGIFITMMRAYRTGAIRIINPAKVHQSLWFYIHRDGNVVILPAMRDVVGLSVSGDKRVDAEIADLKSYRLYDHIIRFVPEGVGHSVDLNAVLYSYLLKTKHGFKTIKDARAQYKSETQVFKPQLFNRGQQ